MLVETKFNLPEYTLDKECDFHSALRFTKTVAAALQTVSAQLRLWVSPELDPTCNEAKAVAGKALDDGLFRVAHKLCEVRVSVDGDAVADGFSGLQSTLRSAFPVLKGNGGNVSVRFMEVKSDSNGDFPRTSIKPTAPFAGAPFAEWSRVSGGILRIARIAWKQSVRADILDPIKELPADPGGDNIKIISEIGANDAVLPHREQENGHRDFGYTTEHVEEMIMKAVQRDRKNRRVRLEERDLMSMIENSYGELALSVRAAAMKRFGLIEPVVIPHIAPIAPMPNRKRKGILPEHVTS